MRNPLISVITTCKNAMPHVRKCVESLQKQTYKNFEYIVQDAASTDGTVEYFESVTSIPRIDFQSAPDSGISQGYNRAIQRCSGELICCLAADESLFEDSLQKAKTWFLDKPEAAIIYGSVKLVNQEGVEQQSYYAGAFSLPKIITCELVPPYAACVFNMKVLSKQDISFDESMQTCMDYDMWLRLGTLYEHKIFSIDELFCSALNDRSSMSFRAEAYAQMCKDKSEALNRWLPSYISGSKQEEVRQAGISGIYLWGVEQVESIEGPSQRAYELVKKAAQVDPYAERLKQMLRKFPQEQLKLLVAEVPELAEELAEELLTSSDLELKPGALNLESFTASINWGSSLDVVDNCLVLTGGPIPWGYGAEIKPAEEFVSSANEDYFVHVQLKVSSGKIGVCLFTGEQLDKEYLIMPEGGLVDVIVRIENISDFSLILRNAGCPGSKAQVHSVSLLSRTKSALTLTA